MNTQDSTLRTRLVSAGLAMLLEVAVVYLFMLFLSNLLLKKADDSFDLHGLPSIVFGLSLGPLWLLPANYIKTGEWRITLPESIQTPSTPVTAASQTGGALSFRGLSPFAILFLLTVFWLLAFLYCQLLYTSIGTAATDPSAIGVHLPDLTAQQIQNTVRGTIYLGTFFPLVAGSAFLCGWLSKQRLSYSKLLVPAFFLYGTVNLLAIWHTGESSIMQAIHHLISVFQQQQHEKALPESLGVSALIGLVALAIFLLIIAALAWYGWLWSICGRWLRQRMEGSSTAIINS